MRVRVCVDGGGGSIIGDERHRETPTITVHTTYPEAHAQRGCPECLYLRGSDGVGLMVSKLATIRWTFSSLLNIRPCTSGTFFRLAASLGHQAVNVAKVSAIPHSFSHVQAIRRCSATTYSVGGSQSTPQGQDRHTAGTHHVNADAVMPVPAP